MSSLAGRGGAISKGPALPHHCSQEEKSDGRRGGLRKDKNRDRGQLQCLSSLGFKKRDSQRVGIRGTVRVKGKDLRSSMGEERHCWRC